MKEEKIILIVDDDVDQLEILKTYVESFGYTAETLTTQKEAEAYIEKNKPALAILDLMLENEDSGFILSYKLKKKYPDVPIIIATSVAAETGILFGLDTPEDKNWIKADLYIEKNIRQDQLHREIKKLIRE